MAQPTTGVCEAWATEADLCSPCDDYDLDPILMAEKLLIASDLLFQLSGNRYPGECSDTVRPTSCECAAGVRHSHRERPTPPPDVLCRGIRLGGSPLVSVTSVKIDGVALDPSEYRIDDHDRLVRLRDSNGTLRRWPCCQDITLDDDAVGTFEVTYVYGQDPPRGGVAAAAALACELFLAAQPEAADRCRLSNRVLSVTRQGVTKQLRDPTLLFPEGRTGLSEVDLWLEAERYSRRNRRASIVVPETAAPRVRRVDT